VRDDSTWMAANPNFHVHRDRAVFDALEAAPGVRRQPLTFTIQCDSRQLDCALMKIGKLIAQVKDAQALGIPTALVTATLGTAAVLASPTRFSRRSLLGFWHGRTR